MSKLTKEKLYNFVQKYNLSGSINDSRWFFDEKNKTLTVMFRNISSMAGIGKLFNIEDLPEFEIGINSSKAILSAISNMDDDMTISMLTSDNIDGFTYLQFKDKDVIKKCKLSDIDAIINKFEGLRTENESDLFDATLEIDEDFINKFNKIENVQDANNIAFNIGSDGNVNVIANYIRERISDNNSFKYTATKIKNEWDNYIMYDIDSFRKIFKSNKNFSTAKLHIGKQTAKFEFEYDDLDLQYKYYVLAFDNG